MQIRALGLPEPVTEYRFAPPRRWRLDLAYPDRKIAIEIDGMVHRIKSRFAADLEKQQALFLAGWMLLRVSPAQVRSGEAVHMVGLACGVECA